MQKTNLSQYFSAYTFSWGGLFRAMGYLFGYKSVILDNAPLFHVWGTLLDPNLCWKLGFLPFYGLSAAFMAFSLKPMNFSEQLSAN